MHAPYIGFEFEKAPHTSPQRPLSKKNLSAKLSRLCLKPLLLDQHPSRQQRFK
jgi:hypothetical protein